MRGIEGMEQKGWMGNIKGVHGSESSGVHGGDIKRIEGILKHQKEGRRLKSG